MPSCSVRVPARPPLFVAAALALGAALLLPGASRAQTPIPPTPAPELDGGTAWINTGKPLKLKDLRGKVVILDFWTLCCINCMHIMPDLAKLEEKYKNQLVVIGVHSPKFDNEKNTEAVRKAVLRYELRHPVVNDADKKIWTAYNAQWWPTIAIIDPQGNLVAGAAGEPRVNFTGIDKVVAGLVAKHRKNKTLDETPVRFDTAKFRDGPDTQLYFPGKVVADVAGKRLLIADSTHHRVVVTDLDGKMIAIAGAGHPGKKDGAFDKAQFDDPQGMAVDGDTVYVADRKNNCLRQLDLKAGTVKTIPGTTRTFTLPNTPRAMACTPWDVWLEGQHLYVAMSGSHQIWVMDVKKRTFAPFAGDQNEEIKDGPRLSAKFAQPSGLTSDGRNLYVADAEVSAVRRVPLDGTGQVETLVGRGLFVFGDRDGPGRVANESQRMTTEALLQHCVGVAYHDGKLYVADTYNSKIKTIDLTTGMVTTFLGGPAKQGEEPVLNEPTGLTFAGDTMYVADTNAHRIRVVDLKTKAVKTLELKGVTPVEQPKDGLKPKK
ncbi:MAG TPA: thioredoxin-like domain-containing protein [Gemmata sp.]|nr:thioredoxin-like domain-containing protein [Gemmata sp.]